MSQNQPVWALPESDGIPPDALQAEINIYRESIVARLHQPEAIYTKLISATELARAFSQQLATTSPLLPPNTLWWKTTSNGSLHALWQEPQIRQLALQHAAFAPPQRLTLPLPGLVFICTPHRPPWVFAALHRPQTEREQLYHAPTFNIFANGRVCPGSHHFPGPPAAIVESFFLSFFSPTGDYRNRSRRHPENLKALWTELDGAADYPLTDLIPSITVQEAMQLP